MICCRIIKRMRVVLGNSGRWTRAWPISCNMNNIPVPGNRMALITPAFLHCNTVLPSVDRDRFLAVLVLWIITQF